MTNNIYEMLIVLKSIDCEAMPPSPDHRGAVFHDFAPEELSVRSYWLTLQTAPFDQWLNWQTKAEDIKHSKHSTWIVPQQVLSMLPECVKRLMPVGANGILRVLRDLDQVELCAGVARPTRWAKLAGLAAIALDRDYQPRFDLCTAEGLAIALVLVFRIRHAGILIAGPQCSSWVWISRSVTKRSANNVMGDESVGSVVEGNTLNKHMALLVGIASSIGVFWLIEQPASSVFFKTQEWIRLIKATKAMRIFTRLEKFEQSPKPSLLYSTAPSAGALGQQPGLRMTNHVKKRNLLEHVVVDRHGKKAITGKRAFLKKSQVYPVRFALEKLTNPDAFSVPACRRN